MRLASFHIERMKMERDRKLTLDLKDQDTWDVIYFLEFMDEKRRKAERPKAIR
jgi:hypothetical protein